MNWNRIFLAGCRFLITGIILGVTSCIEEAKTDPYSMLQSGPWIINSVTRDGVAVDNLFTGLTLSFTSDSYTTTNGGIVWPSTGRWSRSSSSNFSFWRNDGLVVYINSVDESTLSLMLYWKITTYKGGRTESAPGKHIFIFGH